jgi:large subunit ribosomal protein L2
MNAVDHPFGGGGSGKARPPVSKHTPPGRKVGTLSPTRTGKKKRK